jgi:hypothetical protein
MGLARTKAPKSITHWVHKKLGMGSHCNPLELNQAMIADLINEMNAAKGAQERCRCKSNYTILLCMEFYPLVSWPTR